MHVSVMRTDTGLVVETPLGQRLWSETAYAVTVNNTLRCIFLPNPEELDLENDQELMDALESLTIDYF